MWNVQVRNIIHVYNILIKYLILQQVLQDNNSSPTEMISSMPVHLVQLQLLEIKKKKTIQWEGYKLIK